VALPRRGEEGGFSISCPEMELSLKEVYEGLEVPLERTNPEFH
jgi:DNA-binding IscR family transcriptional regulator